jgi:hypothetical protein
LIDFCCVHDDERCNESNHRKIYAEDDFSFGVEPRTLFLFADVLRFLSFASKKSCALHALCGAVIKHGSVAHIGMRKSCVKFLIAGSFGILSGKLVETFVTGRMLNLRLSILYLIVSLCRRLILYRLLILYGRVLRSLLQVVVEGIISRLVFA